MYFLFFCVHFMHQRIILFVLYGVFHECRISCNLCAFLPNQKYRKYRVIIVLKPIISCNIVWTPKKDIAQGWMGWDKLSGTGVFDYRLWLLVKTNQCMRNHTVCFQLDSLCLIMAILCWTFSHKFMRQFVEFCRDRHLRILVLVISP